MTGPPITHFKPDPEALAVLGACVGEPGGDPASEWSANLLSRRTVVYGSGAITRRGDPVRHNVDADELALCRRLAAEASGLLDGIDTGLGSESALHFRGFFSAANADDPVPARVDPALIRARFGGTIFPLATITVELLVEAGVWWDKVLRAAAGIAEDEEADREMEDDGDEEEVEGGVGGKRGGSLPRGLAGDGPVVPRPAGVHGHGVRRDRR